MKVKYFISIIVLLIIAAISKTKAMENLVDMPKIKMSFVKKIDIDYNLTKNADGILFVLDSAIHTQFISDPDTLYRDYYKYDSKGNRIEWINYSTCLYCAKPGNFKKEYEFDENDNCISIVYSDLDLGTQQWVINWKQKMNYDSDNRLLNIYALAYDHTTSEWITFSEIENSYDTNGNLISETKSELNLSSNELVFDSKKEWKFDTNGKLTEISIWKYDIDGERWTPNLKYDYHYDIAGNDSVIFYYYGDQENDMWNLTEKTEYLIDTTGKSSGYSTFSLDTGGQWIGGNRYLYIYDENENQVFMELSLWDEEKSDFVFYNKVEREFNSKNQLEFNISSWWDLDQNDWVPRSKSTYEYDINGNQVKVNEFLWDVDQNDWVTQSKSTYEYDMNGNQIKVNEFRWIPEEEVWRLDDSYEYFYSELITNIESGFLDSQTLRLYPNPANETFTIETQNPEISFGKLYNLNGELVKNLTVQQGINIYNISELKSGVYFIQIPQNERTVVKKLVKN